MTVVTNPEWCLTGSALTALQFAEWLSLEGVRYQNFVDKYQANLETAWAVAEEQRWVQSVQPEPRPRKLGESRREPTPQLTAAGRLHVEEVKRLRSDRAARRAACRQAVLLWLDGDGHGAAGTDRFGSTWHYTFYGTPFSQDEIDEAVAYLMERGLLEGTKTWGPVVVRPALTALGLECVERNQGDVHAFLAAPAMAPVLYTQNFHAPVSGQVGQGAHVQQTQFQGLDTAALAEVFQAMRDAFADLSDDDRDDAEHLMDELNEAVEQGDVVEVKKRTGRLVRFTSRIGSTAVTTAVSVGTTAILHHYGVA